MTAVFKFFIGVIALIFGYFIITPLVLAQSEPPEIVYTFENHLGMKCLRLRSAFFLMAAPAA